MLSRIICLNSSLCCIRGKYSHKFPIIIDKKVDTSPPNMNYYKYVYEI